MNEEKREETKVMEYIDFAPPSDVIENNNGIKVVMDVPGATTESLSIDVEDRILKINADTRLTRNERTVRYKRSFQISDQIAVGKISAKLKDGILELTLPKEESSRVHKVKVITE
jgi:HSP20 family protein